jgi:outer membrane protein
MGRFILIFVLLIPALAAAQETNAKDLSDCIRIALENNPQHVIAQKQLEQSDADAGIAWSTVLPQINASANLQHAWEIQQSTIPNFIKTMLGSAAPPGTPDYVRISFALANSLNYGANLTQPLFLGGAGIAGIRAANEARRAATADLEQSRQDLIYRTVEAYYGVVLAGELVKVQEEALAQANANLETVKKRYDVGSASGFEKMRAEVEVANLQPEVISARNAHKSTLTILNNILGREAGSSIVPGDSLVYTAEATDTLTFDSVLKQALARRPEVTALDARTAAVEEGIAIARSEFLPKLIFATDYSFMANRDDMKFSGSDFSKGFTSALSLQVPLFSGMRSKNQYQKAKLDYQIMQESGRQVRDGIRAEVELVVNKYYEAKEKHESSRETVKLAREALRLANLMYREGSNTQLDVLNSQLALTQARLRNLQSLYEYQMARYQVRKVTGQLYGAL